MDMKKVWVSDGFCTAVFLFILWFSYLFCRQECMKQLHRYSVSYTGLIPLSEECELLWYIHPLLIIPGCLISLYRRKNCGCMNTCSSFSAVWHTLH